MIEIRWHGRGGQGAFTAAKLLGAAAVSKEMFALSFPSFGPERRGAPIQAYTKIDREKITDRSIVTKADYIVYLDETLFSKRSLKDLKENGKIILNSATPERYPSSDIITFDGTRVANEILHRPLTNTAMLAALCMVSKLITADELNVVLPHYLPDSIVKKNQQIVEQVIRELSIKREVESIG